jgi:hypothetical protein
VKKIAQNGALHSYVANKLFPNKISRQNKEILRQKVAPI